MKVLYDTCTVGTLVIGFSQKETADSLQEICEQHHIAAFIDINASECERFKGDKFILLDNYLLYAEAFVNMKVSNDAFKYYTLKSIMHPENVLVDKNSYRSFYDNQSDQFKEAVQPNTDIYLKGIFGFLVFGNSVTVIDTCFANVILSGEDYYRLSYEDDAVTILPFLQRRVKLDQYITVVSNLANMVQPTYTKVYIPLSSTNSKQVKNINVSEDVVNMNYGDNRVQLIRSDGVAVPAAIDVNTIQDYVSGNPDYIGYKDVRGQYTIIRQNLFTSNNQGCKVLPSVAEKCKLYTDLDTEAVQSEDFYLKGYFGTNTNGQPITRVVPFDFTTAMGNRLKFYIARDQSGYNLIRILCTESPESVSLKNLIKEVVIISNMISGRYVSIGLSVSPDTCGMIR